MMEEDAKRRLKAAELQAKKTRLKIWTNYIPPATNSKAIHDQNFTGKVAVYARHTCANLFLFFYFYFLCVVCIVNCVLLTRWWRLLVGTASSWLMMLSHMAVH